MSTNVREMAGLSEAMRGSTGLEADSGWVAWCSSHAASHSKAMHSAVMAGRTGMTRRPMSQCYRSTVKGNKQRSARLKHGVRARVN